MEIKVKRSFFDLRDKKPAQQYLTVFICALTVMLLIMVPFMIADNGYFIYMGDFNCQQIPFYIEVNESIRSGELMWNWNTDLGANLIGSYAFYLIGSPFFWLTLLLPAAWVPSSIPILICIKTAVAATTGFAFARRFLKSINSAFIAGALYAFSGFAFYNIFFNHFHDVIALFPLLLIGVEKLMKDGRKGFLAFGVFINALCNYYFFVAEVVFVIIYFFLRLICKSWGQVTWRRLFCFGLEAVLGFVMAAFVVLPAVLTTMGIDRAFNHLDGWALITYYEVQRPFQILQAYFLPPEIVSAPNVFPDAGGRWASVNAWLPLFGFAGAWTWLGRRPRDFFSRLVVMLMIMSFVPALNATFQLMSNNYYTRWFFMLVLMLAIVTMKAFEECSWKEWRAGIIKSSAVALGLTVPVALIKNPDTGEHGLAPTPELLWAHIAIAVVCLVLTWLIIRYAKRGNNNGTPVLAVFLTAFVLLFGFFYVGVSRGWSSINDHPAYVVHNITARDRMTTELNDGERVDVINTETNAGMYWNMPCLQAFHSVVPGSIFDFYNNTGVKRDVKSETEWDDFAYRSLLSSRYLFDGNNDAEWTYENYEYLYSDNDSAVYEYQLFIPMGFSYDTYLLESELLDNYQDERRCEIMLNTLVVADEQEELVSGVLTKTQRGELRTGDDYLKQAVEARRAQVCDSFTRGKNSFSCDYTAPSDDVIFFSVPYEDGWSATVNGQQAEIIRTNLGFMSVVCEQGENEIVFTYVTPGLVPGAIAAAGALFVLLMYVFVLGRKRREINDGDDLPASRVFLRIGGFFTGKDYVAMADIRRAADAAATSGADLFNAIDKSEASAELSPAAVFSTATEAELPTVPEADIPSVPAAGVPTATEAETPVAPAADVTRRSYTDEELLALLRETEHSEEE